MKTFMKTFNPNSPIRSLKNSHIFKIGDLVTGYYKGYWKILQFDGDLVTCKLVLDSNGDIPKKSTTKQWSLGWTHFVVKQEVIDSIEYDLEMVKTRNQNILSFLL